MVAFFCNEGLIPEGRNTTTCATNVAGPPIQLIWSALSHHLRMKFSIHKCIPARACALSFSDSCVVSVPDPPPACEGLVLRLTQVELTYTEVLVYTAL